MKNFLVYQHIVVLKQGHIDRTVFLYLSLLLSRIQLHTGPISLENTRLSCWILIQSYLSHFPKYITLFHPHSNLPSLFLFCLVTTLIFNHWDFGILRHLLICEWICNLHHVKFFKNWEIRSSPAPTSVRSSPLVKLRDPLCCVFSVSASVEGEIRSVPMNRQGPSVIHVCLCVWLEPPNSFHGLLLVLGWLCCVSPGLSPWIPHERFAWRSNS